jgi:hypothetical protein
MTGKLTRSAYARLIEEDIAWLGGCPPSLERTHIRDVLLASVAHEYPPDWRTLEYAADMIERRPAALAAKHDARVRREALKEAAEVCRRGTWTGKEGTAWRLDCAEEIEELADEPPGKTEEKT